MHPGSVTLLYLAQNATGQVPIPEYPSPREALATAQVFDFRRGVLRLRALGGCALGACGHARDSWALMAPPRRAGWKEAAEAGELEFVRGTIQIRIGASEHCQHPLRKSRLFCRSETMALGRVMFVESWHSA